MKHITGDWRWQLGCLSSLCDPIRESRGTSGSVPRQLNQHLPFRTVDEESLPGFNSLLIEPGPDRAHFDPYWPEDEEYYSSVED
ncbi:hypothetical protein [Sphingobium sp.]|uniref:hypothetical protein n=1 Tax=Sphingobium sp. TaxID=1912891 RepID=UPI003BB58CB9